MATAAATTLEASATDQIVSGRAQASARLVPLDWMRGLVMILMTLDHASDFLNKGRFITDGSFMWKAGTAIPVDQFLFRWLTHLCAPTFVFLAGVSIALSSQRRRQLGESEASIDSALLKRGLLIALLDPLWMSMAMMEGHGILFQVIYAIGVSMMLMVPLRKLPDRTLAIAALSFFAISEILTGVSVMLSGGQPSVLSALTLSAGLFEISLGPLEQFIIAYPAIHWLAIMALGHACANWFVRASREKRVEQGLLRAGLGALALFAVVRGANGYGNMRLYRDSLDLAQWLHVSKYPPSISYLALELGLMALLLAGFFRLERSSASRALAPLLSKLALLGQTALFFYVLHVHVLASVTLGLGLHRAFEIGGAVVGAALTILALYYPCALYRRYKSAHPNGFARYL